MGEPRVDGRTDNNIGCSGGRSGGCGWAAHGGVGCWEGNGWCYEGLEVVVVGYDIGVVGAWALGGSVADVNPGDPCRPVHVWKKFGIKPMGEFSGTAWVWGYLLVKPWCW